MRQTDPSQVFGMKRDPMLVEQVDPRRSPTEYMIQYIDKRWRRVYAKWKGAPYIVMMEQEIILDPVTSLRVSRLGKREYTDDEWIAIRQLADNENNWRDSPTVRAIMSSPVEDDDIPF